MAAHDVTPSEFEFILNDPRTVDLNCRVADSGEDRFRIVGMTQEGRLLVGVYTIRDRKIRPVAAFDASRKETLQWLRNQ